MAYCLRFTFLKSITKFSKMAPPGTITQRSKKISEITVPDIEDSVPPMWESSTWMAKQMEILDNIRKMRAISKAPVDAKGCDKCADEEADEKTQRFHKLVALLLSSQTKDDTTFECMNRLKSVGLTPKSIASMNTETLQDLLKPVSFYKNKAKYMQQTAQILIDKYNCDIPNNIKELIALPGVGPKMAHICMATAWNEVTGIGVDVHVHRIANRLNWVPTKTKMPEQTRKALEEWIPRELWQEVNHLLVGFGQTICTPLRPHCGECLNSDICPSAEEGTSKGRKQAKGKTKGSETTEESEATIVKKFKYQKKKMQI